MECMLFTVLSFSNGEALMKFDTTSHYMRRIAVPRAICNGAHTNKALSQGRKQHERLSITSSRYTYPTGYTLFCIERNICMICKKSYFGVMHPDFNVYVHDTCMNRILSPHTRIINPYGVPYILQNLPHMFSGIRIMVLLRRQPGFPRSSVQEWQLAIQTHAQQHWADKHEYAMKNRQSAQRVRYLRHKAIKIAWADAADEYARSLGTWPSYSVMKRRLVPALRRHFQCDYRLYTEQHAVTKVGIVLQMQRVFDVRFILVGLHSGIPIEQWATLTEVVPFQQELLTLHCTRIFAIATCIHAAYSRQVRPNEHMTNLLRYAIIDNGMHHYIETLLSP